MKKAIKSIQERNRRVESDKAWEVSKTRRALIAILTYAVMIIFLIAINAPNPFVNAIVPTIGFILSTLTLSFFKKLWLKKF